MGSLWFLAGAVVVMLSFRLALSWSEKERASSQWTLQYLKEMFAETSSDRKVAEKVPQVIDALNSLIVATEKSERTLGQLVLNMYRNPAKARSLATGEGASEMEVAAGIRVVNASPASREEPEEAGFEIDGKKVDPEQIARALVSAKPTGTG